MVIISYLLWVHRPQLSHKMHTWHNFCKFETLQVNVDIIYTSMTLALTCGNHLKEGLEGD